MKTKHIYNLWIGLAFMTASALILPSSVYAQGDDARPLKIGYVNANQVVSNAPQGKIAQAELNQKYAQREEDINELQIQLQEMEQKKKDTSADLTESEKIDLDSEIRLLTRQIERATADLNEEYNIDRNRRLAELQDLISVEILKMAREEGFDLIVQSPVVWASERIDITKAILDRLETISGQ